MKQKISVFVDLKKDVGTIYVHHNEHSLKTCIANESYENLEEAIGAIAFFSDYYNKEQLPFILAIELKKTQELIGDTGINDTP